MNKVAFKRQGFADLLYLDAGQVFVEYHHLSGSIEISDQEVNNHWKLGFRGKTEYRGENPLQAVSEVESLIKKHTGVTVSIIDEYIEAYLITSKKPLYDFTAKDKQYFKGICIDGLTLQEVREKTNLNVEKDLGYYKIELVRDLLETESEKLNKMLFAEFITMLHDHHYKQNFRAIVQARIG